MLILFTAVSFAEDAPAVAAEFRPGSGIRFESEDGIWRMDLGVRLQFREAAEFVGDTMEMGFTIPRARLNIGGTAFSKDIRYKTQIALSPRDVGITDGVATASPLLDAWIDFTYVRDANVRFGQYKLPFSRERIASSGDLQFVDRSFVEGEFNLERDIGVHVTSNDLGGVDKRLGYWVGAYSGYNRTTTGAAPPAPLFVARVHALPLGDFDYYSEGGLAREEDFRFGVGGAFAMHVDAPLDQGNRGDLPTDGGTTDFLHATADAAARFRGLSLDGAFHWRDGTRDGGPLGPVAAPLDGIGANVQAGVMLPEIPVEVAGRFGWLGPLDDASALAELREISGGLNVYLYGHDLWWSNDVVSIVSPGSDPELLVRSQLQIVP